jgi:hypothetical protein
MKKSQKKTKELNLIKKIRKPVPPPSRPHEKKKYDRKKFKSDTKDEKDGLM